MRFRILFIAAIVCICSAVAQTPADTTTVVTIVERLQSPDSPISIEAPEVLLQRALPSPDSQDQQSENTEEATEDTEAEKAHNSRGTKVVGYRVQVFADNNARTAKSEARQRERAISQAFPDYGTYVSYASPYWRLRVGNFRSKYEADKAADEIRRQFPRYAREVRVVRDRVIVR